MADEHRCAACASVFPTREALQAHARSEHQTVQQFSCAACGGAFASQEALSAHAREAHARP